MNLKFRSNDFPALAAETIPSSDKKGVPLARPPLPHAGLVKLPFFVSRTLTIILTRNLGVAQKKPVIDVPSQQIPEPTQ